MLALNRAVHTLHHAPWEGGPRKCDSFYRGRKIMRDVSHTSFDFYHVHKI